MKKIDFECKNNCIVLYLPFKKSFSKKIKNLFKNFELEVCILFYEIWLYIKKDSPFNRKINIYI